MTLTLEEQERILLVAQNLIKEPESWVRGSWKCPAPKYNEKGGLVRAEPGDPTLPGHSFAQATDHNGNPLYQYCIEGAVNQAAVSVLGEKRAQEYVPGIAHPELDMSHQLASSQLAYALGLDAIAKRLYGAEGAMAYNDTNEDDEEDHGLEPSTHEGVLEILRTRLREIVAERKESKV